MLKKNVYKLLKVTSVALMILSVFGVSNVSAATISKTLKGGHSTTQVSVTTKYYTHEVNRWDVGNPIIIGSSGKGGGASKNGAPSTSKNGNNYKCSQIVSISATDYNYITTSGKRKFQWVMNGTTNKWVSNECKVTTVK